MHFRFRINSIQVVRSQPDAETGKAKSVPLGSINRATLEISEKLRSNCTPAELREIEDRVRRYQSIEKLKTRHAAFTLTEQMASAAQWFNEADAGEARLVAEDIISTMAVLRRALTRRGLL